MGIRTYTDVQRSARIARSKLWAKNNPEAARAHAKKSIRKVFRSDPRKYLLAGAKRRAAAKDISFEITVDDIHIPKMCPILMVELGPILGSLEDRPRSPSLDRIDNSEGYVPGNVAVVSFKANQYKSDLSLEQIRKLYAYISP